MQDHDPPARHVGLHRLVMGLLGPFIPILGLMEDVSPRVYDPMAARWLLMVVCLMGFWLSFRVPRHQIRYLTLTAGYASYIWFIYCFARNGLPPANIVGLVLLVCIVSFAIETPLELLASMASILLSLLYLAVATHDPGTPMHIVFTMFLLLNVGFGYMGISRSALEHRLHEANRTLEARVRERTEALQQTVERLDAEATVREAAERQARAASQAKSDFL
ncbi:MAG: hypothetical protein KC656_28370, partial [Myxococcales bacterium]|nr:hypothetical protein [Myxococcales bacterium]